MTSASSTGTTGSTAGQRTITAFFDSREDANNAIQRLVQAGIPRGDINMVEGASRSGTSSTASTGSVTRDDEGLGFWEALKDLFLPDEDRSTYAEGLRRGGYLVSVRASAAQYERALDILDDEGTIDIDQRASSWRQEGWTAGSYGSRTSATGTGTSGSGIAGAVGAAGGSMGAAASRATGTSTTGAAATGSTARTGATATTGREEVIPVVEEQLRVGKREVNQGRVRVRSYVVETPVQEQVTLREEHVHVERRPVDRPITDADNLFRERTIEATESAEQAVVAKEARVKEELVVNKEVEQRTETVSDKVRRTEVEVEDERGNTIRSGEDRTRR